MRSLASAAAGGSFAPGGRRRDGRGISPSDPKKRLSAGGIAGRPTRTSRPRTPVFALAALAALLLSAALAAPASAAAPTFDSAFTCNVATPCGTITSNFTPERLAVNEQTGDVYVMDIGNDAVVVFNSAGVYQSTISGSSTTARTFSFGGGQLGAGGPFETDIAVDNSGGANEGNIYVVSEHSSGIDGGPAGVFAFRSDGTFLWQANPAAGGTDMCGVAVDSSGALWVADFSLGVRQLDPTTGATIGSPLFSNGNVNGTCQLATDSHGNFFTRLWAMNGGVVGKYDSLGNHVGTLDSGNSFDVATDSTNDNVYLAQRTQVAEYDSAGNAVSGTPFGSTELGSGFAIGVAVNGPGRRVYVADRTSGNIDIYDIPAPTHTLSVTVNGTGNGSVDADSGLIANCTNGGGTCSDSYPEGTVVRLTATPTNSTITWSGGGCSGSSTSCNVTMSADESVTVTFNQNKPTVGGENSSGVSQTGATLAGTANPNGAATTCLVEWGTTTGYGTRVAVSTNPGSGTSAVPVSAPALSGLSANTLYHWRLDCTNAGGTTNGSDQTFRTLAPPPTPAPSATTGAASGVTPTGATLAGTVNPNGSATSCRFEYGTTTAYGSSVDCASAPGGGASAVAVSAALSGLSAGTTYHYRLDATNAGGTTNGADMTFATPTPPPGLGTLVLKSKTATVTKGKAALKVACQGGAGSTCSGKLTLTARVKKGKKRKTIVVGSVNVRLNAGQSATLSVKLSGTAKSLLAKAPHKLAASASGGGLKKATSVTLKQAVAKKHKKKH